MLGDWLWPEHGCCYPPQSGPGAKVSGNKVPESQENWMMVLDLEDASSGDADAAKCARPQQFILSKTKCVFASEVCLVAGVQVKPRICLSRQFAASMHVHVRV